MSPALVAELERMRKSCQTESVAVADCLFDIAAGVDDDVEVEDRSDSDAYILGCAEEIRDVANDVIKTIQQIQSKG